MAGSDVMSRIKTQTIGKNALAASGPSSHTRFAGGSKRENQPYITGYWYAMIRPPQKIFGTGQEATTWLFTTAESFTPHSRTITKADVPGMGGLGSSFVAGQDISRTFTLAFREYQNLPVMNTIELWTSVMDQHLGVSPLQGFEFIPANYKGSAVILLCRPTIGDGGAAQLKMDDIEQMYFYDGVFPETVPHDSFSAEITGNDSITLSVTFSFDGHPLTKATALEGDINAILTKFNSVAGNNDNSYSAINKENSDSGTAQASWKTGKKETKNTNAGTL